MDPNTTESTQPQIATNPLAQWYRQPKIYIKLPSKGNYYPNGALDKSSNEEYPVFSMTAKDELMFKTPDALLTGQSTVEVIKSCIPAIKDPWSMPSIDVDFCLIAIRIATYGEKMEVNSKCPHCEEENSYDINLTEWMGRFAGWEYRPTINVDPLVVHVRPYTYKETTKTALKTIEQQRTFNIINDDNMPDEEKLDRFNKSFVKLTELTVEIIADCISKIETPNGTTTDLAQIKDFINNCPKDLFDSITVHLTKMKDSVQLEAQLTRCTSCEKDYTLPITMDQSNFFGARSRN